MLFFLSASSSRTRDILSAAVCWLSSLKKAETTTKVLPERTVVTQAGFFTRDYRIVTGGWKILSLAEYFLENNELEQAVSALEENKDNLKLKWLTFWLDKCFKCALLNYDEK